jgi:uncharacterized protein (TIRG00374 family)
MIDRIRWLVRDSSPLAGQARRWLRVILLAMLFVILFQIIPLDQFASALLHAHPGPLLIGLSLGIPATLLTAAELMFLVRMQGIQMGLFQVFAINLSIKFYTLVTPGSMIGSGIRWMKISAPQGMPVESLAALAFFRLLEIFLTLAFGIAFFVLSDHQARQAIAWLVLLLVFSIAGWLAVMRVSTRIVRWLGGRMDAECSGELRRKISRYLGRFIAAMATYADSSFRQLSIAMLAGIASQLVSISSALYLARAMDIELTFLQMGWVNAGVLLATQLPFGLAGGLGLREATLVALLPTQGIDAASALAFSLLQFLRWVMLGIIGGLWEASALLRSRGGTVSQEKEKPN